MPSLNNGEPRSSGVIPPKTVADLGRLAVEYHPGKNGIDPVEVNLTNPTLFSWRCAVCGHEWEAAPFDRFEGRESCSQCRERKQGLDPLY